MNTNAATREKSDSRTPDYKKPPKKLQAAAKAERNRRKACHGSWLHCESHA